MVTNSTGYSLVTDGDLAAELFLQNVGAVGAVLTGHRRGTGHRERKADLDGFNGGFLLYRAAGAHGNDHEHGENKR